MTYIDRLKVDLSFGTISEINHLDTFKFCFNDMTIRRSKPNYEFDYEGDNLLIELKTRSNKKDKYEDTMIGHNKIKKAKTLMKQNESLNIYFVFSFTDGLYYWKYNPLFILKTQLGGRNDRGRPEMKTYAYIPVVELLPLSNLNL